jgi:hypothetical protein
MTKPRPQYSGHGWLVNGRYSRSRSWDEIWVRELTEQFLRGRVQGTNLLDEYEAACKVQRLAARTIPTDRR